MSLIERLLERAAVLGESYAKAYINGKYDHCDRLKAEFEQLKIEGIRQFSSTHSYIQAQAQTQAQAQAQHLRHLQQKYGAAISGYQATEPESTEIRIDFSLTP